MEKQMNAMYLTLFYESRLSVHLDETDVTTNPNTELAKVPDSAMIRFGDDEEPTKVTPETFGQKGGGYEVARFLIERSMLDPDAHVIPLTEVPT